MQASEWGGLAWVLVACALTACAEPVGDSVTGYVEAIYVRPAPASGGRLTTLTVDRGARVAAGQPLFTLDAEREQAQVAEAEHRLEGLQARRADLGKGARREERAVIRAQLQQAQAQLLLSQATARRQSELAEKGLASRDALDTATAAQARDVARVAELKRQIEVADLAGRADALEAAQQDIAAAQAQLAQARWALAQKSVVAPAAGSVEDVYFRPGEWVSAGQPVLALLPPENRRLRFFVPQSRLSQFAPGQAVRASCEGCGAPVEARVSFRANEAEFAPPVLFDRHQRTRLVYRIEALPGSADAARLNPGQPVDVEAVGG